MSLHSVQMISYDLGDCTKWEFMFPGLDKPLLQIPEADDDLLLDDDDEVTVRPFFWLAFCLSFFLFFLSFSFSCVQILT